VGGEHSREGNHGEVYHTYVVFLILDFGIWNVPLLNSPSEFNGVKIVE